jgi:hypothetical protein
MSVAASKRLLWDSFDLDREAVGARETDIHLQVMGHEDARECVHTWNGAAAVDRPAARPTA